MSEFSGLNLSSILPKAGAFQHLSFSVVRELEIDDIMRIGSGGKLSHRPLQNIRAIHHRLAQLLAQGFSIKDIAAMTGSSRQRIDKLSVDPTFTDLISYYQDQIGTTAIEDGHRIQEKLKTIAESALDEINDRLMDDEIRAAMPISELRKITELGMDRTVAPPKASVQITNPPQQITLNIGAPRFAETNTKKLPPIIDQLNSEEEPSSTNENEEKE